MTDSLSESSIVREVANCAARRIARKVIGDFQRMHHTLSGEDSELKTVWDEICVQVQHEESYFWDEYDEMVSSLLAHSVAELPRHEQEAMWLQTDAGSDWACKTPENREDHPICHDDIVEYLKNEHLYRQADKWSNPRIRRFIDRSARGD